eukprot:CAMPEP_0115341308 /NCGR_PEP_ID=MMETSP0270-20121206/91607_1 /TAXON_ID=71861 /ORGANISM="Scrippsiella trochoidea, Strain CCMP3099" /LENGTH=301 /DNA_ID=CAMNT_0002762813 /DNA_START=36 /DNA_END=939 /DNA_ORIENTATION=+
MGILKQMKDEMAQDKKDMIATEEAAVKTYGELMKAKKDENRALTKQTMEKLDRMGDLSQEIIEMKNDQTDTGRRLAKGRRFATQDNKDMVATEESAKQAYDELMQAKKNEARALAKAIMEKLDRRGDIKVEIAEMKEDHEDTVRRLAKDKEFQVGMKKNCATKEQVYEEEKNMRAQEVTALAETIKMLNSDDALELFKKTLPSAGSSFLQLQTTDASMRTQAQALVNQARSKVRTKLGLEKVVKMINRLVATMQEERAADDRKKEYCTEQFATTADKKEALKRSVSDISTAMVEIKEGVAT